MHVKETEFAKRINGGQNDEANPSFNLLDDRKDDHFSSGQVKSYHFYATDRIAVARYLTAMGQTVTVMPPHASVLFIFTSTDSVSGQIYTSISFNDQPITIASCANKTKCTLKEFSDFIVARFTITSADLACYKSSDHVELISQ
jgi:hypothetical protein